MQERGGAGRSKGGAKRSREDERVHTGYTVTVRPLLLSNLAVLSLVSIIPAPLPPPPLCSSSLLPAPPLSCTCVITPTHLLAGRSREEERVHTGYTVNVRHLLLSNLAVLSLVSIIPAPLLPPPLCSSLLLPAPRSSLLLLFPACSTKRKHVFKSANS